MKMIPVSGGRAFTMVDDDVFDALSMYRWARSGTKGRYVARRVARKTVYLHRIIMDAPPGIEVDHINRNPLDNRRENLRLCTHQQNGANIPSKRVKAPFRGLLLCKGTNGGWYVHLKCSGKRIYVGLFADPIEAARAYDREAVRLFGEFATLNFPDEHGR